MYSSPKTRMSPGSLRWARNRRLYRGMGGSTFNGTGLPGNLLVVASNLENALMMLYVMQETGIDGLGVQRLMMSFINYFPDPLSAPRSSRNLRTSRESITSHLHHHTSLMREYVYILASRAPFERSIRQAVVSAERTFCRRGRRI